MDRPYIFLYRNWNDTSRKNHHFLDNIFQKYLEFDRKGLGSAVFSLIFSNQSTTMIILIKICFFDRLQYRCAYSNAPDIEFGVPFQNMHPYRYLIDK